MLVLISDFCCSKSLLVRMFYYEFSLKFTQEAFGSVHPVRSGLDDIETLGRHKLSARSKLYMALLPQGTRVSPKLSFCAWFELPAGSIKEFCCVMVTCAEPGHEHSQCEGQDPRKPSRDGASVAFGF